MNEIYNVYYRTILSNNQPSMLQPNHLLQALNAHYVILQSDSVAVPGIEAPYNGTLILHSLLNQTDLHFEGTYGNLTIFKSSSPSSLFYSSHLLVSLGNLSNCIDVMLNHSFNLLDTSVYSGSIPSLFQSDSTRNGQVESMSLTVSKIPKVNYERINPTSYVAHIQDSGSPFFLTFSQTFNSGWVASINGNELPVNDHIAVNGFANSWYINRTGSFNVSIEFAPQNELLYFGTASVIGTVIFLILLYLISADGSTKFKVSNRYRRD